MTCQHCARDTVDQATFCNYCGERVAVSCTSCKRLNPPDSLYCHGCGRSLTESHAEPPAPASEPSRPQPIGGGCPRCGAANEPASAYCFQCGLPFDGDLRPQAGNAAASAHLYRSPWTRAIWTSVLLVVTGITIAIYIGLTTEVLDLRQRYEAGEFLVVSRLADAEENKDIAQVFYGLVFIATAVAFLMWTYRASHNLRPLGTMGQRFSPRWAVGWWFVPIMFLFRPYQVVAEIWKGSAPDAPRGATFAWDAEGVSALLAWWWALWLASNLIGLVGGLAVGADEGSPGALRVELLGDALSVCAAVLAIAVVWRTTSRQARKHHRIMNG